MAILSISSFQACNIPEVNVMNQKKDPNLNTDEQKVTSDKSSAPDSNWEKDHRWIWAAATVSAIVLIVVFVFLIGQIIKQYT